MPYLLRKLNKPELLLLKVVLNLNPYFVPMSYMMLTSVISLLLLSAIFQLYHDYNT
jgi:hypothetical protein